MVARDIARIRATFCKFSQLCLATLRDFIKNIANGRKNSIHMTSFVLVRDLLLPSATLRDFARLLSATLAATMRRLGPK
jgi:hypothetical protein